MRRPIRRLAAVAAVAVASVASAGQAAKFEQVPPKEFRPLDLALRLDSGVAAKRDHETFDLAAGIALASCPTGAWSGRATFTGLAGGTIEWQGRLWRCFPFGDGTATYPNGTRHTGTVNSYLRSPAAPGLLLGAAAEAFRLDASSVRMAVREGKGSFTRADGSTLQGEFLRGEPLDPKDVEDEQALRLKAFAAALATLDLQLRQAELLVQRELAAAKAAEDRRIAEEKRKVEEARRAAERAEAERVAAERARLDKARDELAASRARLTGAVPWAGAAVAAAPSAPLETDAASCWVDPALLQEWVAARNAINAGTGFRQVGMADAEQRFRESRQYMLGASPDSLRALVQRDDEYFAKVGIGAHSIGLIQIGQEQARGSYAEHRILRALRVCVADRKQNALQVAERERLAAEQRQTAALAAAAAAAAAADDPAAKACIDSYQSQERYFSAINARRPADGDLIPELQTVMYMLETRLAMLDKVCKGHALYAEHPEVRRALDQAVETCRALTVSPDVCHGDIAW